MGIKPKKSLLMKIKDWWWLYGAIGAVASVIVLWGGIPGRLAQAEEAIDDLKSFTKELMGYTRAQQEYNQRQQQSPVQYQSHVQEWEDSKGVVWCCDDSRADCKLDESWWRCG